jgi:hypothetical protein
MSTHDVKISYKKIDPQGYHLIEKLKVESHVVAKTFGKAYIVLEGFDYGIFFHVNNDPSTHSISIISWSHYYSFNSNKQSVCPSRSTTHNLKNIGHWGLLFFVIVDYN